MNEAVFVMRLSVVLFLWLVSFPALAFEARVIGVQDGDTITVLEGQEPIKVRLHGIDAPERKQPFGTRARQFTSDLVFSKTVRIEGEKKDRYGRLLAVVILEDGRYLNEEIVYAGFAWWYRHYAPDDKVLEGLEEDARHHQRGLWADNHPVPPWEWRKDRLGKTPVGLARGTESVILFHDFVWPPKPAARGRAFQACAPMGLAARWNRTLHKCSI